MGHAIDRVMLQDFKIEFAGRDRQSQDKADALNKVYDYDRTQSVTLNPREDYIGTCG